MAAPANGFAIQGDYLFTPRGIPEGNELGNGQIACYRLALNAPDLLWEADDGVLFPTAKNIGVYLHDGTVFMRSNNDIHLYDLSTGAKQGAIEFAGPGSGKDDQGIVFRINNYMYNIIDSQHGPYETVVFDMDSKQVVGQFTLSHPGLAYSSQMVPVIHGDRVILRRSYCRISALTFHQLPDANLAIQINEPIKVVATEETASFSATVTNGTASRVRFFLDESEMAIDDEAPFTCTVSRDKAGAYQIHAIVEDASGKYR